MKYSINNWDGFRRLWLNRTLSRIERITFWVLPLGLMTVGLVLYRSHLQGFDAQRAILIPAVIMLLGTLTFRSRIAAPIRLQIYCLYLFLLGISGLLTLGLLGLGLIALVFAQAIAALGGVRLWLVFLTLSTLGVVAVGLCFIFGVLELPVDAGEFMRNPMSWGMALLVFSGHGLHGHPLGQGVALASPLELGAGKDAGSFLDLERAIPAEEPGGGNRSHRGGVTRWPSCCAIPPVGRRHPRTGRPTACGAGRAPR